MTFHRLLFREILLPLVLALVLVCQLLVVMQMLQLNEVLFGSGFDPLGVLKIAGYLAPHFAVIAVPLAFLLAVMLGVGRLAEDNELVALSALGRSPLLLYRVPLLMSLVLGLAVGFIAIRGVPWGLRGIHRQINELIKRNVAGDIRPGTFYEDIPRFTVFVGEAQGEQWRNVLLHDAGGTGEQPMLMLARKGQVESNGADAVLRLDLSEGELHRADGASYTRARFDDGSVALGVYEFMRTRNKFIRPAGELEFEEMPRAAAEAFAAGDKRNGNRILTAFHNRLGAMGTCFVFALIAVPLAATGRGARGRSFFATVLAFAGYYVVQTVCTGASEEGRMWAPLAAWVPNLVGLVIALALGWRLARGQGLGARK